MAKPIRDTASECARQVAAALSTAEKADPLNATLRCAIEMVYLRLHAIKPFIGEAFMETVKASRSGQSN